MSLRPLLIASLALVVGCAANRNAAPAATFTGATCDRMRVTTQDTTWREAVAGAFTFCVPADWQPSGGSGRRWRSPGGTFELDLEARTIRSFRVVRMGDRASMEPPDVSVSSDRHAVIDHVTEGKLIRLMLDHPAGFSVPTPSSRERPVIVLNAEARTIDAAREVVVILQSFRPLPASP